MTRSTSPDPEVGMPAPVAPAPGDDLGRVAVVFALVAVGAAVVPVVNWFSPWVALVAVVLAIFALCLPRLPRRRAALSLGLGVLALGLAALLPPVYAGNPPEPLWWISTGTSTDGAAAAPAATTISYEVTGTVPTARVVWSPTSRPEGGFALEESAALPFTRDVAIEAGDLTRAGGAPLVLGGTLGEDGGEITCRMRVGDRTLVERTATGPGATAGCSTASVDPELLPEP